MNLLPAVEAYIAERRAQLKRRNPVPVEILRELEAISGLCRGLSTQAEILDKLLTFPEVHPRREDGPCGLCEGEAGQHTPDCPRHPRNLTKL
jgi:hypothetical protein